MSSPNGPNCLEMLDDERKRTFQLAVMNILSTHVAENTYAQILDGLPTCDSMGDSYVYMDNHPSYATDHEQICPGFLEKARDFRAGFDISQLSLKPSLLTAFQNTTPGTKSHHLRLIELVVVACHDIAAHLFKLDDGAHKHQVHQDWLDKAVPLAKERMHPNGFYLPSVAFFHRAYQNEDHYPRGVGDTVGYWAEGKIFGGVIIFDRGETENECNDMWIHGDLIRGPSTFYPPTQEQFTSLVTFLLAEPDQVKSLHHPLPIHGTSANRPRWHPYYALQRFHIFRDKYERELPASPPGRRCMLSDLDWPELLDEMILVEHAQAEARGDPVDEEEAKAARAGLMGVTPSSPLAWPRLSD